MMNDPNTFFDEKANELPIIEEGAEVPASVLVEFIDGRGEHDGE